MKNLKPISCLLLFAFFMYSSCQKDKEETSPSSDNTPVLVNGSISGLVTNQAEEALPGVQITFGINNTITDENGYFSFKNVEINAKGSLVTVEKEGSILAPLKMLVVS